MNRAIAERFAGEPFIAHPLLQNNHAQTIAGFLLPRQVKAVRQMTESRFFDVGHGVRVLSHCSWSDKAAATIVAVHGLEGSSESHYMLGTAAQAINAGFNIVRLNLRNCGGTEHLAPNLYHAGLTDDVSAVVQELAKRDRLGPIWLAGFSLGGNIVLKLAGETPGSLPSAVAGIIAVSPSIHLPSCVQAIELRSNLFYHLRFLRSMKRRLRRKARHFPERYDASHLKKVWSIRSFDNFYTAPLSGFRDADDYYERASAMPFLGSIKLPTLIIHAKDDPFIPFAPFERIQRAMNPNLMLIAPSRGGHVGFISASDEPMARFWAEAKIVEFVRALSAGR